MKPAIQLNTPVQYLKGVGPKMAKKLANLEIKNVGDLLYYFPRNYIDYSKIQDIKNTRIGDIVVFCAKVISISNIKTRKKKFVITKVKLEQVSEQDTKIAISAIWFNQPFLQNILGVGSVWYFMGKINYDFNLKEKILLSPTFEKKSKIVPIYSLTYGLTNNYFRKIISSITNSEDLSPILKDFFSKDILDKFNLVSLSDAIKEIHFPTSDNRLEESRKRLSFDELFFIILKLALVKKENLTKKSTSLQIKKNTLVKFVKSLPYKLTNAQRKASWEILNDLSKEVPMNRLLEGDVGSGKTIVALIASLNIIRNGYQVIWMAPTEILATQHYQTACELLNKLNITISMITSKKLKTNNSKFKTISDNSKLKNELMKQDLIIGTHALIQKGCKYKNIGLVIIDEQHRFGVKQRAALTQSNNLNKQSDRTTETSLIPHFLSMTATPIPRTLALSIYSDLDISILDEMPKNRKKIITKLVDPVNREKAYQFVCEQIKNGRQVFIVCPLIEENNNKQLTNNIKLFDLDKKSVKAEYEKLSKRIFPDLCITMLHGKMKSEEKEKIMKDFLEKKSDILISTSVIEVGIDVPNAAIIIIEDAERFGLAQLHQFRGRVGRSNFQSYCLLFTSNLSIEVRNRLKKLEKCSDGFKLAEIDLVLRGPGELLGKHQSGRKNLKIAKLTDIITINKAKSVVDLIIKQNIKNFPIILKKLDEENFLHHLE